MYMHRKDRKRVEWELAVEAIHGNPETAHEMVNKYGTYEIQPTTNTENVFPLIGQGLPEQWKELKIDKYDLEREE